MNITYILKINDHFMKKVIFNVLISKLGLKLQLIDEPIQADFIDPIYPSNREKRTILKFHFHFPRFEGAEIRNFPDSLLS